MIVSKSRSGFTLVETLFALAFFALCSVPVLMLQSSMLLSVATFSERAQRVILMKSFLFQARREFLKQDDATQFAFEKKIERPETILRYKVEPVADRSSLKHIAALYTERVVAEWRAGNLQQEESLVAVFFKEPPEKEKGAVS